MPAIMLTLLLAAAMPSPAACFAPINQRASSASASPGPRPGLRRGSAPLRMAVFDVTKSQFDPLSLRSVRGDAIIRYNALNQSEPLRINLYLLATLACLSYPATSEAVIGEPATFLGTALAGAAGAFGGYRFVRECRRRARKLTKMEKELMAQELTVRLPAGPFADRPFGETAFPVGELLKKRRVLAVCGDGEQLREALVPIRALRRRFAQANALVVAVSTDGSSSRDWGASDAEIRACQFLAQPEDAAEWADYFAGLLGDAGDVEGGELAWFGLSSSGKSFGSGSGSIRPIEILGRNLLPVEMLSEEDAADSKGSSGSTSEEDVRSILAAQRRFYEALTTGDRGGMERVCATQPSAEVDEVVREGGGIDDWAKCLEEGARPSGMTTSGSDVLMVSDTEAYSTTIEFPPVEGTADATLLAVQRWMRASGGGEWRLALHQTIPWSPDVRAGATLRCDCRGCTALTREQDRQYNWRGMID